MTRSMVGLLLAAVAAAVPILVADVHGSAIIMLAILAAGCGGGIYIFSSKKSVSAAASTSSAQKDVSAACTPSALKKCLDRHGASHQSYSALTFLPESHKITDEARRARSGPGLWPGSRRQARWVGRNL